jgi:hypothetical protein
MAIIKELNSNFGCSVSYHRITAININYRIKKVIICVASYLNKESRVNQYDSLEEIDIEVPIEDFFNFKDTNVLQNAYLWLKENVVGFEDCVDDFEVIDVNTHTEETKEVISKAGVINEQDNVF